MSRVLYFFPHNPCPPRSGAHKRSLEMLAGLAAANLEVVFASTTLSSETEWTEQSQAELRRAGARAVKVYATTLPDRAFLTAAYAFYRRTRAKRTINSILNTPPGMRRWFARLCRDERPELIVTSYAFWDGLLNSRIRAQSRSAVDILDLYTVQLAMRNKLLGPLPTGRRLSVADVPEYVLDEAYFSDLDVPDVKDEFHIFDQYTLTICISGQEANLVRASTRRTQVVRIPMSHDAIELHNTYSGAALFTTGPNPLNMQGYFYFAKKVLPRLRKTLPDFGLNMTGSVCDWVEPEDGIALLGFVQDLVPLFETARFLICPIIGRTGQLIKIVEAMAHGVPVIALETAATNSPIQHGVNGWIARDAAEFTAYCSQMWRDTDLCRQMGQAARQTIAEQYSREGNSELIARSVSHLLKA